MSDEQPKRPLKIGFGFGRKQDRATPAATPVTPPTRETRTGGSDAWDVIDPTMADGSKPPPRTAPYATPASSDAWEVGKPSPKRDSYVVPDPKDPKDG